MGDRSLRSKDKGHLAYDPCKGFEAYGEPILTLKKAYLENPQMQLLSEFYYRTYPILENPDQYIVDDDSITTFSRYAVGYIPYFSSRTSSGSCE